MHRHPRSFLLPVLLALAGLALGGCGGSKQGLKLTLLDASARRPSNVAVYFTVETAEGEPVAGLTADQFRIYEDGQPVSALESKQTILNPEVAASHNTLLLVDMSGSVTESGDVPVIIEAVRSFTTRVEKYQKVAIYAFDGSKQPTRIVGFSQGPELAAGVDRLAEFQPKDPSTNLNGAIIEAMKDLDRQMRSGQSPLTFGTLVVFTDGTDRAGRVPREQLHETVDAAEVDLLVIGVGAEVDSGELSRIGRDGAILNKDRKSIAASFEEAAARVEAFSKRYYLLGYCSPARAGVHQVTIETTHAGQSGALTYEFKADGFGPNCDPNTPPSFNTKRPKAPKVTSGASSAPANRF